MKRTNIFKLKTTKEQEQKLVELDDNCSKMWNEISYKRRKSFLAGVINRTVARSLLLSLV